MKIYIHINLSSFVFCYYKKIKPFTTKKVRILTVLMIYRRF